MTRISPDDCAETELPRDANWVAKPSFQKPQGSIPVPEWLAGVLASPLCHKRRHGGSVGSEGSESQVGVKRGKEHGDRSLTISYSIGC